jgi:glycosyltransferase involved in cell wall biosynthesis
MPNYSKPLVSIIVPCYNQACYLPDALSSVLSQTYVNWECIIVNDGSPDDTEERAQDWVRKDARFKYISKPNGGLSSARNAGIRASQGEFVLPLDADDYISANYVEECLNVLLHNSECKVAYGAATLFGESNGEWILPEYDYKSLLTGNMIFCTALYARKDWELNKGYDENLVYGWEDWEFWIHLLQRGGYAQRVTNSVFYYRIKKQSMVSLINSDEYKSAFSYQYILNKHKKTYNLYDITADAFLDIKKHRAFMENSLAERSTQLAERDRQLAERDRQLAERNAQLAEIYASRGWAVIISMRKLKTHLLPSNSWLDKVFRFFMHFWHQ